MTASTAFTGSTELDDGRLAQRIRSGDREALGELYDRYSSFALGLAVRVIADRGLAEDVVHDAFLTVWQKIDRFDTKRGSLRSWLLTIVRNRAIDRVRAQRPTLEVDLADERSLLCTSANPTFDGAVANRSARQLHAAISRLPDAQRRAVGLAYFGGYTYREVAALTDVSQGTASGRLRLALAKLQKALRLTDASPGDDSYGGSVPS